MEYLPLGNLADQRAISEWEAITLLCRGLDALDYLNSHKVVHRDLKPETFWFSVESPEISTSKLLILAWLRITLS